DCSGTHSKRRRNATLTWPSTLSARPRNGSVPWSWVRARPRSYRCRVGVEMPKRERKIFPTVEEARLEHGLHTAKEDYEKTGNVWFAREAADYCYTNGYPVDEWILKYLLDAVHQLVQRRWSGKKLSPADVAKAFGLAGERGQPPATTDFDQIARDFDFA